MTRPSQICRTVKMKSATTMIRTRGSRRASHDPRPRYRGAMFIGGPASPGSASQLRLYRFPRVDEDRDENDRSDEVADDDRDVQRRDDRADVELLQDRVGEDEEEADDD